MSSIAILRERLVSEALEAIIITNLKNVYYLSGFWGTAGTLLITTKAQYLFTDSRYSSAAKLAAPDFVLIETRDAMSEIKHLLAKELINQVGFETTLSYGEFQAMLDCLTPVALKPLTNFVEIQRQIKTDDEIATIKKACQISDRAYLEMLKFVEPGKTELDIANFLDFKMRELGASGTSFDTIVASGLRSALPHGRATHKPIEFGDCVTVDFGCYYNHYASDMTRTFFVGDADPKLKEIYQVVAQAQQVVSDVSKAGLSFGAYDFAARSVIEAAGYGQAFSHGIGHGLGLDVHELPYFPKDSQGKLQHHMVITNEPGIYIDGVGGVRIEDDLLITTQGTEILTLAPKELIIV